MLCVVIWLCMFNCFVFLLVMFVLGNLVVNMCKLLMVLVIVVIGVVGVVVIVDVGVVVVYEWKFGIWSVIYQVWCFFL